MAGYIYEWGAFVFRWLHVVAAMAWIGASFFFMHLDAGLKPDATISKGGLDWHVHGGGFYEMRKYLYAPPQMPEEIVWHKWQAYTTWLSGFALLVVIYYAQASLYLVNPEVMDLSGPQAALIGLAALATGWLAYDRLCKSPIGRNEGLLAVSGFALVILASYGFAHVFSGRGALIHTGALMATCMAGNVFFVIIPNQRRIVRALKAGQVPDPTLSDQAKQRSTHNNYITLPVVALMLMNHTALFYAVPARIPFVVGLVTIAGASIRHFFNVRHKDHARSPWWVWGLAAALMALLFALSAKAAPSEGAATTVTNPVADEVLAIVASRCSMCHARQPMWPDVVTAPKGVLLETPADILREAPAIRMQAVLARTMPPNNLTQISEDERATLGRFVEGR